MNGYLLNENGCANGPFNIYTFLLKIPLPQLNVLWEKIGPGIAFETLTLAILGWLLFTTAAAAVCTEREGLQTLERSFPRPREKQIRMLDSLSKAHPSGM